MDIPGESKKDTPKAKKHREQLIVVGTVVLVILTFMMVSRRGSNSVAGAGGVNGFTPDTSGGSGGAGDMSYLPAMLGALPGQVAALEQGNSQQEQAQLSGIQGTLNTIAERLQPAAIKKTVTKKAAPKKAAKHKPAPHKATMHPQHPSLSHHPIAPAHPIVVSHHTPAHPTTLRKVGKHPAAHATPARTGTGHRAMLG